jgi:hypothetical protein
MSSSAQSIWTSGGKTGALFGLDAAALQLAAAGGKSMMPCLPKKPSALRQTVSLNLPLAAFQSILSQTRCAKDRLEIDGISPSACWIN